jgi:hypothetical protein
MSRATKSSKNAAIPTGPPPSHAIEHHAEHRAFLIRSLDRCDTEFAALTRLNRSLKTVRESVKEKCGESILLDLGQGLIKLNPTDDGLDGDSVKLLKTEEAHGLCCEFLWHFKLRRRLLNRVARRLNRVAHSMDGHDISPPFAPKYGDLRLHVDTKVVQDYAEHWKRQEEARERIELTKSGSQIEQKCDPQEHDDTMPVNSKDEEKPTVPKEESTVPDATASDTPKTAPDATGSNAVPDTPEDTTIPSLEDDYALVRDYNAAYEHTLDLNTGQVTYSIAGDQPDEQEIRHGIGATHRTMTLKEKELELKRWQTSLLTKIPEQPTAQDLGLANRVFRLEDRLKELEEKELKEVQAKEEELKAKKKEVKELKEKEKKQVKDEEEDAFMDDDDEEKDSDEEDEEKDSDEEDEEKDSDEEEEKDSDDDEEEKDSDEEEDDDKEEEEDDEDKEEEEDDEDKKEVDTDAKDKKDKDDDNEDDKEDEEEKKKDQEDLVIPKVVRPMSLLPSPSFHDQDMKRIRLIHADLMATSIHEHARRRISEVTNDYNHSFRTSNEFYNQRVKLQTDLNTISHQHRMEVSKLKNDYTMQTAIARARWSKQKETWEIEKAKKKMQGMYGQMPVGTNRTQAASRHPNQIYNSVGLALGRVIDAVVMNFEGAPSDGEKFGDFMPPPHPNVDNLVVDQATGETYAQRNNRVETQARTQMQSLSNRLQQSEEDRKRTWRKLLKTKAEFEVPSAGRRRLDPSQIHTIPVPPLRASQAVPHSASTYQPAPVPAYVPPTRAPAMIIRSPEDMSDSKYSAARVRERISSDGTVAPVSEPKRDKDGLFMRPAGRTRKGMNWDAVRGIWVPEPNYR